MAVLPGPSQLTDHPVHIPQLSGLGCIVKATSGGRVLTDLLKEREVAPAYIVKVTDVKNGRR